MIATVSCMELRREDPFYRDPGFERMIIGRLDAEYVGTDNCVSKCHSHDKIAEYFRRSVHGEQLSIEDNLPLVNCESCHGPGSLAIAKIPEGEEGLKGRCDKSTLLDIANLPSGAKSLICLKCHAIVTRELLSHWRSGAHALNGVSCFDCHKLHLGPGQKVTRQEADGLCLQCHSDGPDELEPFSDHPSVGRKMVCIDCHNPHGSAREKLLKDGVLFPGQENGG